MTTRAGSTGLITGIIAALAACFCFPKLAVGELNWLAVGLVGLVVLLGGWLAARRSGSRQPVRCAVLGAFSGAAAGTILFYGWGAAAAGRTAASLSVGSALTATIVAATFRMFLVLFAGGGFLGALGGGLACVGRPARKDTFDKSDPQMALNLTVTAVPACVFAAVVSAVFSSSLSMIIKDRFTADLPLESSLILLLLSLTALIFVLPHEADQAEHRCGLDEVRMLGVVGAAAGPLLGILLLFVSPRCFSNPLVDVELLAALALSFKALHTLITRVIPRRAQLPAPWQGQIKQEALLFGSISNSQAPRLIQLCAGCGLVMVMPLQVCVISVLVNLNSAPRVSEWGLFLKQVLISSGLSAAAVLVLVLIYMVYLSLGRKFARRTSDGK